MPAGFASRGGPGVALPARRIGGWGGGLADGGGGRTGWVPNDLCGSGSLGGRLARVAGQAVRGKAGSDG
ncbi:hypothetical protein GCM10009565_84320 [Amycolatopsis albidoflavus]